MHFWLDYGGVVMSKENPGVIFDASNSWNGYNHQGKLAILFAIKQILEVYDKSLSVKENKRILEEYFVEIEYLEDFSIGKQVNGKKEEYYFVHQVKNHATEVASDYDSALLGLAYHVEKMPTLKNAYLHVTTDIDFKGESIHEYIKKLISMPTELNKILTRIEAVRNDEEQKEKLYSKKKGRPENFISRLKSALVEEDDTQKRLTESNIDVALDCLEKITRKQITDISALSDEQISKIDLYSYDISGVQQPFCEVDQIETLVKDEIKRSINKLGLPELWLNSKYINNRYLFLLGKLDEHIVERNLNYPLYMNRTKDRKIRLDVVLEWIICGDIETSDDYFYQYKLKENFMKYSNEYCQKCKVGKCESCLIVSAINKIGQMTYAEMHDFLVLTCPSNSEGLSMETIPKYLSRRNIGNPFFRGIRDISIPFEADKRAVTYIDKDTLQYILTTLVIDEDFDDNAKICSDIYKNKALYELLMDYDCFISENMSCSSVLDEVKKIGKNLGDDAVLDERRKEHIAHLKDVSIIRLNDFEKSI